ncbi:MAG: hypothetical protein LBR10_10360, partial [Prevotellaceae bacterium]|nr:hypothetical protein [Prevotellaceae bacterium]
ASRTSDGASRTSDDVSRTSDDVSRTSDDVSRTRVKTPVRVVSILKKVFKVLKDGRVQSDDKEKFV